VFFFYKKKFKYIFALYFCYFYSILSLFSRIVKTGNSVWSDSIHYRLMI